jgi:hypothetical protein
MPATTFGPRRVVRVNGRAIDPGLDLEASNLVGYRLTREERHLVWRAGAAPCWFTLAPLTHRFATLVLDSIPSASERLELACRAALTLVEPPGEEPLRPSKVEEWRHGARVADESWVDELVARFGVGTIKEMGQVAYDLTQLPAGADGPFVWPPGSAAML